MGISGILYCGENGCTADRQSAYQQIPASGDDEEAARQECTGEEPKAKQWPYLDGEAVPVYAASREMAQKLMDFLEEADFTPGSRLRDMTVSIILEESEAYYTGDKGLDEVVKLMQEPGEPGFGRVRNDAGTTGTALLNPKTCSS